MVLCLDCPTLQHFIFVRLINHSTTLIFYPQSMANDLLSTTATQSLDNIRKLQSFISIFMLFIVARRDTLIPLDKNIFCFYGKDKVNLLKKKPFWCTLVNDCFNILCLTEAWTKLDM